MKSLAELQAIKEKMKGKVSLREGSSDIRVVVGMATCGIAAGARPVLNKFVEEVEKAGLAGRVHFRSCRFLSLGANHTFFPIFFKITFTFSVRYSIILLL